MKDKTRDHLKRILQKIEKASAQIIATRGYNSDTARLKILEELLKEQVVHENIGNTTR